MTKLIPPCPEKRVLYVLVICITIAHLVKAGKPHINTALNELKRNIVDIRQYFIN